MNNRTRVFVYAGDPVSQAGVAAQLRTRGELLVVEETEVDSAEVALVVADEVDDETVCVVKALQRNGCPRVVLVVTRVDDSGMLAGVEAGACGLLRRSDARPERLGSAIAAAARGDGTMPPDMLGRFLLQVGHLQRNVLSPRGITFSGLTEREVEVLRLVADGHDTADVAERLCYSQRTVKNVIHDVTTRLRLKNRTHAVAYALRQGLI